MVNLMYVMVHQEHLTEFFPLVADNIRDEDVAKCLRDMFYFLGAPDILQSNNGREFIKVKVKVTVQMP
jgi:hypothetical protein